MAIRPRAEQHIFMCRQHQFVIVAKTHGGMDSRGSPGHRQSGCAECDQAVDEAWDYAGLPRTTPKQPSLL